MSESIQDQEVEQVYNLDAFLRYLLQYQKIFVVAVLTTYILIASVKVRWNPCWSNSACTLAENKLLHDCSLLTNLKRISCFRVEPLLSEIYENKKPKSGQRIVSKHDPSVHSFYFSLHDARVKNSTELQLILHTIKTF